MAFNNAAQIQRMAARLQAQIQSSLNAGAVLARNHYVNSFRVGGFVDESLQAWQKRKQVDRGRRRGSRAILVQSGNLRNSIRARAIGYSIIVSSDLPYAEIHNNGGRGRAFGRTDFTMPKRQFIGNSGVLNRKILALLSRNIDRSFRSTR